MDDIAITADLLDPPKTGVLAYRDNPAGFIEDCVVWKPGRGPAKYQLENMQAVVEHGRVAIRAGRGAGKTTTHAWLILWFALTRDAARDDWKVIATASVYRQLKAYLWLEVERKWGANLRWEAIGREPFKTGIEMMRDELRLKHGSVTLAAATDPAKIEGAHADELLYIFDEAKAIPDAIFDSAEGAFSGAGEDTDQKAYVIASSTPGAPEGRFFDIHNKGDGLDDWHCIHITKDQVVEERRMAPKWAKARLEQFGEESSWYQNHVLGEFAAEAHDGVIRQVTLERAHERWLELDLEKTIYTGEFAVPFLPSLGPLHAVGVDLAAGGRDRSVYALRYGNVVGALMLRPQEKDTMVPTGEVKAILSSAEHRPVGIVDATGLGIPVLNRLQEQSMNVQPFVASEASALRTRDSIMGFVDSRAAAWWSLREMLEPTSGMELAIPPDDQLTADLLAPKWKMESGGRIRVESKDDIRSRLKRSTDAGDAVVQVFWTAANARASAPVLLKGNSRWAPARQSIYSGMR